MDYKISEKFSFCLIIITCCFLFGSCKQSNDTNLFAVEEQRDSGSYISTVVDFYSSDYFVSVNNVIKYDDYYYVVEQRISQDNYESSNYLSCLNSVGEKISDFPISSDINIYVSSDIVDGKFIFVTFSGELIKVDIFTGNVVYTSRFNGSLCGVISCDDGYVVLSVGRIDKFDSEDNLIASIANDEWQFFNGYKTFYNYNNKYYLLADTGFQWKYYELNFENSTSNLIYDPTQNESLLLGCSGEYLFDDSGEYLLDIENSCMYPLIKWDDMNLQPPQYTNADPQYIGVDNETFLQIYNYDSGIAQLIIYSYDENLDYGDRICLTVGGFNCSSDLALNWAVYKYNLSQSEYHIIIEDYNKNFGWNSLDEAIVQKAALIAYFNEGNAPDIYYGNSFDYESLNNSGALLNITDYMSADFVNKFNGVTPNIRDLMTNEDGSCYRIFSSYQIEGYSSTFNIDSNLSIDEAIDLSISNNVTMFPAELSSDLATYAIQSGVGQNLYTREELQQILEYSYSYGFEENSNSSTVQMNNFEVNDYLLWNTNIFSIISMGELIRDCQQDFVFVGYPSINGSKHVIIPFGQIGISSSTSYPEECVQFASYLLDDDVQDLNNMSWVIPVNDECMRKMVSYSVNHADIPSEDYPYRMFLCVWDEVDETAVECFYSYIENVDTIRYYDWGIVQIVYEETQTYYTQDKPISEIVDSMYSRLSVYLSEG